jgi:hypothetical protein
MLVYGSQISELPNFRIKLNRVKSLRKENHAFVSVREELVHPALANAVIAME